MKPAISCASIDTGIVAGEHRFLKAYPGADTPRVQIPESFVSDLLLKEHSFLEAFAQKLAKTAEPERKPFFCAVIRLMPPPPPSQRGSVSPAETQLKKIISDKEGFWGRIKNDVYALALWGAQKKAGKNRILMIQEDLEQSLDLKISLGMTMYPQIDFTPRETFHNALKALDHASFFNPGSAILFGEASLNIWGDRLYQLGRIHDAARQYEKGLVLAPDNLNLINSLGVCYGIMNRFDLAKEQFQKAMDLDKGEVMAAYNIGLACHLMGDTDTGLAHIKRASRMNPDIFEVELTLGNLLLETDDTDGAEVHLERSKELKPFSHLPCRSLGDFFLKTGHPEKAVPFFNKAIRLNPSDASSMSGLARAYEFQDINMEIALTFAQQSVILDPENHLFLKRLGRIYLKQNLHKEARDAFERAGVDAETMETPDIDENHKKTA